MKFRLLNKDASEVVHDGLAMVQKAPEVITWAHRAFVRDGQETLRGDVTEIYREVAAYRIGGFK